MGINSGWLPAADFAPVVEKSWKALYEKNGFYLERIEEPISKLTETATSIIFIGKAAPEK